MAGIVLGFVPEGIACDDRLPFLCGADEEVRSKIEALCGLRLQQAFHVGARSPVTTKDEIAALEQ